MLKILGILFLFLLFLMIRGLLKIVRVSKKVSKSARRHRENTYSSNNNEYSDTNASKRFSKNEGEYVDYEEIKDGN